MKGGDAQNQVLEWIRNNNGWCRRHHPIGHLDLNVEYRYKLFDFQGFYKILFSSNYTLKYNENRPYT